MLQDTNGPFFLSGNIKRKETAYIFYGDVVVDMDGFSTASCGAVLITAVWHKPLYLDFMDPCWL